MGLFVGWLKPPRLADRHFFCSFNESKKSLADFAKSKSRAIERIKIRKHDWRNFEFVFSLIRTPAHGEKSLAHFPKSK